MQNATSKKLPKSIETLRAALQEYESRGGGELPFLTVCKSLEIVVEYAWREMKKMVEAQGLFAPSPKEAIRQAASAGFISCPEKWMKILLARNDSVHDYFGIPEDRYIDFVKQLLEISPELLKAISAAEED